MDPLFLIGPDLNPIEYVKSQFNEIYQRRLRIYQTEESDLSYLPKGAFSFVFSWHHFEFLPYDIIDQYLEGVFKMLRPGGIAFLSYANCLLEKSAQNFEDHYYCYMTPELIEMVIWVLTECSNITKTLVLIGNHDFLENTLFALFAKTAPRICFS